MITTHNSEGLKPALSRIFRLDAGREEDWSYAGRMWIRIGKFADEFCPDTVSAFLVQNVKEDFVRPHPGFLILGYRNEDYDLCGHLLACVSVPGWGQKRRCLILQYQLDEGVPIGLIQAAFDRYIEDWAKEQYCCEIIAETKTEEARRIFTTFYNFEIDLVQVRRSL